ncbi:NRDE family protein [Alteromonas sp. D210916BOD_24]
MRSDYPLIIAANRDEFYARPTALSQYWPHYPNLLAGQDLQAKGTWMGVTHQGTLAALTNVRDPHNLKHSAISRGELVADWLINTSEKYSMDKAQVYLDKLRKTRDNYNGYNLLFGHVNQLRVYNNVNDTCHFIDKGVFGLSNADIVTPWPKVTQGVNALNHYIDNASTIEHDALFTILQQNNQAPDHSLPDTGVGYEWEKALSSIFIHTPQYGTRASTLLLVDKNQKVTWKELTYYHDGRVDSTKTYTFNVV